MTRFMTAFIMSSILQSLSGQTLQPPVRTEVLSQATSSWDGTKYSSYPRGVPQLTVLKITIPPHTTLAWHRHPSPNAAYVLSGTLTVERKDGTKASFKTGQAISESVNVVHRGTSGDDPTVLIVFYAGTSSLPLSESAMGTMNAPTGHSHP
ncbi:cupin domain-containing protein [Granulicella sp. L60]|uniref:cupin domain-containing protein n=1 Tax=Granulicella sp. L60 TaxID=1641866 RepID=UPI0020B1686D|nr:cupin domain-containing protein [Granulicella sp. L60]